MTAPLPLSFPIAFIGGGNMASALIGGLLRQGLPAGQIEVVEPFEPARAALLGRFGVTARPAPTTALVVWAVKPQTFRDAALPAAAHTARALHLSVAAGIGTQSIVRGRM